MLNQLSQKQLEPPLPLATVLTEALMKRIRFFLFQVFKLNLAVHLFAGSSVWVGTSLYCLTFLAILYEPNSSKFNIPTVSCLQYLMSSGLISMFFFDSWGVWSIWMVRVSAWLVQRWLSRGTQTEVHYTHTCTCTWRVCVMKNMWRVRVRTSNTVCIVNCVTESKFRVCFHLLSTSN